MSDLLAPQDIQSRALAMGRSMASVCREAGVAQSTFWRWREGKTDLTIGVYRRLVAAVSAKPVTDHHSEART